MTMLRKTLIAALLALASTVAIAADMVNINTASIEQLATLDGIGDSRAQAIVEYREANGGFPSVAALVNVDGIGPSTLEKNRARLTVASE